MPGTNYQSELKQPPQPTARLALWSLVLLLCLPILMPLLLALVSVLMSLVWSTDAHAQAFALPRSLQHQLAADASTPPATAKPTTPLTDQELWDSYLQPQAQWPALASLATADIAALPPPPAQDPAQVALGRQLFHDPGLSSDGKVSCASCHKPELAFADSRRISPGVEGRLGKRNAPTLLDVHLWHDLFWDNRSPSLEHQALQPLLDPQEMASSATHAEQYVQQSSVYPDNLTWADIAAALSAFQRSLTAYNAAVDDHDGASNNRLDRFLHALAEGEYDVARATLSTQELRGLHLFRTQAGCVRCHSGPLLSDQQLHVTGFHYYGRKYEDLGAYEHTGQLAHLGAFRTPTLRHVSNTGPWFHQGILPHLRGVIRQYAAGGPRPKRPPQLPWVQPYPVTSDLVIPFSLSSAEEDAIIAFLHML